MVDYKGEELLIPAQEDFIMDIDQKHKVITVDLPEGLLALDDTEEAWIRRETQSSNYK